MIDPFQNLYGVRAGIILMIPVLIADILFAAVVLSSLGKANGYSSTFSLKRHSSGADKYRLPGR